MTIRARFTLWYVGVMFVSLVALCFFSFYEFVIEAEEHPHHVVLGTDDYDHSALKEIIEIIILCAVPSVLIATLGGWWLIHHTLTPLRQLSDAADQLNEHNLQSHLPRSGNGDELDRLAATLNGMTARLNRAFHRVNEFTALASHELKTPLALMRASLESSLDMDNESRTDRRDRIAGQLEEIERISRIVDDLNFLAKSDIQSPPPTPKPASLDALVREATEDCLVLAQSTGRTVALGTCETVTILGYEDSLRRLLLNLIDNAVTYNFPGGTIHIELARQAQQAILSVVNTGPTLSTEEQAKAFEPFFRGKDAAEVNPKGSGLGLSICRSIAGQHRATLSFVSSPNGTNLVTVTLPIHPDSA